VTERHTDRQTDRPRYLVCNNRPNLRTYCDAAYSEGSAGRDKYASIIAQRVTGRTQWFVRCPRYQSITRITRRRRKQLETSHRASTSMYSLTFCVRFLLPERHQTKPAIQAATVMLRTPLVDSQSPASKPRPLPIYGAQF